VLSKFPREQVGDAVDGVCGNLGEHGAEVQFRIEAVELGGADEAVERSSAISACIGASEQVVLATESDSSDILPMSVRNLRFTIVGIRSLGGKFAIEIANSAAAGVSSRWTTVLAQSL